MKIQTKLANLPESIFSKMTKLANEYKAINLSQGFPNFETSTELQNLVSKAMKEGHNQYAPMRGNEELRETIANKIKKCYQASYKADTEICITSGATEALFNTIIGLIQPKDEVILFKPAFDTYEPVITLAGGKTVPIQLYYPNYSIDWNEVSAKINTNTKMIIVNTPHNPTGTIFTKADFLALEKLVKDTNIVVVSDEVYEHMTFDNQLHYSASSFSDLKKQTVVVASFGKTFHNTGWKLGYAIAPDYLMNEIVKVHEFNVFSVNAPFQQAFATFIQNEDNYNYLPTFFQEKRDLFINGLNGSRFTLKPTKGTYFQLLKYDTITNLPDVEVAEILVKKFGIATIPVSVFNTNGLDEKVLRFCFAKTDETLTKATEILCQIHSI